MELILHAGTHKTATTTFQSICTAMRAELAMDGLCFPKYKTWNQHSFAAWDLQAHDEDAVKTFLASCYMQARKSGCRKVLLSGEDFENCLVDTHLARIFQELAESVGFTRIRWIIVKRDPFEYVQSIYAEKARYGVVINMDVLCNAALRYGFFSLASRNYNYKFVFDVEKFAARLEREIDADVSVIPFPDFRHEFVGHAILSQHLSTQSIARVQAFANSLGKTNSRLSDEMVERLYACNFFNTKPKSGYSTGRVHLFNHLIRMRLGLSAQIENDMRDRFAREFGEARGTGGRQ